MIFSSRKSSDFTLRDLTQPFLHCDDASEVDERVDDVFLVLRQWRSDIVPNSGREYACTCGCAALYRMERYSSVCLFHSHIFTIDTPALSPARPHARTHTRPTTRRVPLFRKKLSPGGNLPAPRRRLFPLYRLQRSSDPSGRGELLCRKRQRKVQPR